MEQFTNVEEQRLWNNQYLWANNGHEWSKSFGDTESLWNQHIFKHVKQFRDKKILEIAPGFGRMTQFLSILASELSIVDLNELCIQKTREKLNDHVKNYYINDGLTIPEVEDNSHELVFSFDSFVHFHSNVILSYVKEINRILVPGGYGFIHHSWFYGGSDLSFQNIAGRSNMSPEEFKLIVESNNMTIIDQPIIVFEPLDEWNGVDCISIFKKNDYV